MSKYVKKNLKSLVAKLKEGDSNKKDFDKPEVKKFWSPKIEKDQETVDYVVRFLPNKDTDFAWINLQTHMFTFPQGSYVSINCPQRHKVEDPETGKPAKCPICKVVNDIYDTQDERQIKAIASDRRAKKRFLANILVIKDPRDDGANEGKVFTWSFGLQVQELLMDNIEDEDYTFFDPEDGADFKVHVRWTGQGKQKYPNYTKSKFVNENSGIELDGKELDEEGIDKLLEECEALGERLKPEKFLSVDKIGKVYENQGFKGLTKADDGEEVAPKKAVVVEDEEEEEETPKPKKKKEKKPEPEPDLDDDDDSDDDLDDLLSDL